VSWCGERFGIKSQTAAKSRWLVLAVNAHTARKLNPSFSLYDSQVRIRPLCVFVASSGSDNSNRRQARSRLSTRTIDQILGQVGVCGCGGDG
jgi:hypothetical protein